MNKLHKVSISSLMAIMLSTTILPSVQISANELKDTPILSQKSTDLLLETPVSVAEQFIHFDTTSKTFIVESAGLIQAVTPEEYNAIIECIKNMNISIKQSLEMNDGNTNIKVCTPSGEKIYLYQSTSRAIGKNDVEFYWNFVRVFLTPTGAKRVIQGGLSIAGIFVPSNLLKALLVTIGVGVEFLYNLKSGIWFDCNYFLGVFTPPYVITQWGYQ